MFLKDNRNTTKQERLPYQQNNPSAAISNRPLPDYAYITSESASKVVKLKGPLINYSYRRAAATATTQRDIIDWNLTPLNNGVFSQLPNGSAKPLFISIAD